MEAIRQRGYLGLYWNTRLRFHRSSQRQLTFVEGSRQHVRGGFYECSGSLVVGIRDPRHSGRSGDAVA